MCCPSASYAALMADASMMRPCSHPPPTPLLPLTAQGPMSHLHDAEKSHGGACTQARDMEALSVGAEWTQLLYRKDAPVPTGSQEVMLATKA